MSKGKTNQPITFAVPYEWAETEFCRELVEKGHRVIPVAIHDDCDVILGPTCHMMNDKMLKQKGILTALMAAARKRKREAK